MIHDRQLFRIVVLEDSEFFNDVMTKQLKRYARILSLNKGCDFDIESYTSASDCLRNMKEDTAIAFVDYYLGNGITAIDILRKIRRKCVDCKVIVISQVRNIRMSAITLTEGASEFLFKDAQVFPRACLILEDIINSRLGNGPLYYPKHMPS